MLLLTCTICCSFQWLEEETGCTGAQRLVCYVYSVTIYVCLLIPDLLYSIVLLYYCLSEKDLELSNCSLMSRMEVLAGAQTELAQLRENAEREKSEAVAIVEEKHQQQLVQVCSYS